MSASGGGGWDNLEEVGFLSWVILMRTEKGTEGAKPGEECRGAEMNSPGNSQETFTSDPFCDWGT